MLCAPLLFVCLFQGDIPAYRNGVFDVLLSLVSILPAFAVYIASRFSRIQIALLCLLVVIVGIEASEGIRPTSQLNHEGSDLPFLVLHAAYFVLAVGVVLAAYAWLTVKRLVGSNI